MTQVVGIKVWRGTRPGVVRSQGIISHDIDLGSSNRLKSHMGRFSCHNICLLSSHSIKEHSLIHCESGLIYFLWRSCVCTLTHWGRVTHIYVSKLITIGSDNGLSPEWRQAIIWTNAGILLIGPMGTNFSEILIEIQTFSLKKIRLKMLSAKCWPFCLSLNVLITCDY